MSRFLLITGDSAFEQKVRLATAGGLPGEVLAVKPALLASPDNLLDLLAVQQPEVLVLGPGIALENALRLATVVDVRFPNLSMVLITAESSSAALAAMRAGVRDVIEPHADIPTVRLLLERACQAYASRNRVDSVDAVTAKQERGLVVGVFSPKGGVGKTTIATNLAIGLGKLAPMGVVLVDLDLQFGDVASNLYLNPEYSVLDAVSSAASGDTMILKAFLAPHPSGIYALCAPSSPADADNISADQLGKLIKQLSAEFSYVVLDTGPGLTEHSIAALEQSTDAVWVTAMDVPSVRGLRSGLDVIGRLDLFPETRHVVLNFADSKTGLSVQDIEATLGAPIDVSIPRSRSLSLATNRGVPLLQDEVRDPATKQLRRLVERFDPKWRARSQRGTHRRVVV